MKVLFLVSYLTIEGDIEFSRNVTGYGYMVRDIADNISKYNINVDVFIQNGFTRGKIYHNINILKKRWIDIIRNIKLIYIFQGIKAALKERSPFKNRLRIFFYYITTGYFEKLVKDNKYDIVHVHGVGHEFIPAIDFCERNQIKYIVTLHGLYSFEYGQNISKNVRQIERKFLQNVAQKNIPVTVISTGIRRKILNYLQQNEGNNFYVVPNGCEVVVKTEETKLIDIRENYSIYSKYEIMLCVGNITSNKNQIQVVRAYSKLHLEVKNKFVILFLGKDFTNGEIEKEIAELGLNDRLKLCGNIPRNEIYSYYAQANSTVLTSISEGFGLSNIEGFVYGLPNLTFGDLDAVPDIFDEKAMIIVDKRTDEALAKGMVAMLSKKWDKEYIKQHAQHFSTQSMAKRYIDFYSDVLRERNK